MSYLRLSSSGHPNVPNHGKEWGLKLPRPGWTKLVGRGSVVDSDVRQCSGRASLHFSTARNDVAVFHRNGVTLQLG